MANYTIDWLNHRHTLLVSTFQSGWTWQDFMAELRQRREIITNATDLVDQIADFTGTDRPPQPLPTSIDLTREARPLVTDPHMGLYVIVGLDPITDHIGEVYAQLFSNGGERLHYTPNLNEAHTLIGERRTSHR